MLVKKFIRNLLCFALLVLCIVVEKSSQLEVDIVCSNVISKEYYHIRSTMSCDMPSLSISDFDTIIGSAKAEYKNHSTYPTTSIEVVYFRNAPNMHFMLSGIKASFPKLKGLAFNKAGLFHLDQHDMKPFGADLLWVQFEHTQLEVLTGDLFAENLNLVYIDFEYNPLVYIDSLLFESFKLMRGVRDIDMRHCGCMSTEYKQLAGQDINNFNWDMGNCNKISNKLDYHERMRTRKLANDQNDYDEEE